MLAFKPLQTAKRKLRAYAAVGSHDPEDGYREKRYDSDSDDDADTDYSATSASSSSPYSSRVSSGVHKPMIRVRPRNMSTRPTVSAYSYRNPRAFSRYFALALGSTMVLVVLVLVSGSLSSARSVQQGSSRPPPAPAVWESFPFLHRYHGGVRTLIAREKNVPEYPTRVDRDPDARSDDVAPRGDTPDEEPKAESEWGPIPPSEAFDPFPDYDSRSYRDAYGPVEPCYIDEKNKVRIPQLRAFHGVPQGMPENIMGSHDVLGVRRDVCFERFGRLGPYGLGYSRTFGGTGAGTEGDREGIELVWTNGTQIDFRDVRWQDVVQRCEDKNRHRFAPKPKSRTHFYQAMPMSGSDDETLDAVPGDMAQLEARDTLPTPAPAHTPPRKKLLPRTCFLIRTWSDFPYDEEDVLFLRSLISELAIQSRGEYTVHFLIHVKDDNKPIWSDEAAYQQTLQDALPPEFAGMGTLWSERQMGLIYGGLEESMYRNLPVHGAYRSTFMPVAYFSHQHPEFEYVWHWEMDIRYTGHYYHLLDKVGAWAARQPRKGLWERNARFYVPAEHGSWEDFSHMVRVQTEHGTNNRANTWSSDLPPNPHVAETEPVRPERAVWGPEPPLDYPDMELEPAVAPPAQYADEAPTWGVDEPADLIVFNPLFDPAGTNWILADDVTGYNLTQGAPPRRTAINTASRLSRRLLATMHRETALHRHTMFSEMWPGSLALHHGLKAVYAPHPVYIDRRWPVSYLAAIFNNGRNGAAGGARLSVFSDERQHNFRGTTWYYDAGFAPNLWKRWLGYKVDNDGGEADELLGEGRMCLPAVLLHPVKHVDLVVEAAEGGVLED